jgi:uncharacterized membrane protein YbhN (UPF0104 family)
MSTANTIPGPVVRKRTLQFAGSIALLAVIALVFPRDKLIQALASIPASTLIAALPIYLALHLLGTWKWHWMVNSAGADLPFRQSVRCYFGGLFANLFIPSVIGGDVVAIALGITKARTKEAIVSGTLASRAIDLGALAALVCLSVLALPREMNSTGERLMQLVLGVLIASAALAFAVLFTFRRFVRGRAAAYLNVFLDAWRRPGLTSAVFVCSLTMQTGLIALSAWIAAGCGVRVPAGAWFFAWPLAKLAGLIPVTLAGIGSRELVLPALLAPFGADPAAAASVGLAWDGVLICGSLCAAVISKSAGPRT